MRTIALLPCLLLAAYRASSMTPPAASTVPIDGVARAADGLPIAYEARGAGEPALVFVHGWGCDRAYWSEQIDAFDDTQRVVALDLGGHGESGADRAAWSVAGLAGDVEAVADAVGLESFVLVGHSMGGPVSLAAAAAMPGRVLAVIGVDTLHDAERVFPKPLIEHLAQSYESDFRGMMQSAVRSMFLADADPKVVAWVVERASGTPRVPAVALLRDFASIDLAALLFAARVPVRCINAAPYAQVGPSTATEKNRKYADFDAQLVEGVGHYLMLERPVEFDVRLREVLDSLSGIRTP